MPVNWNETLNIYWFKNGGWSFKIWKKNKINRTHDVNYPFAIGMDGFNISMPKWYKTEHKNKEKKEIIK